MLSLSPMTMASSENTSSCCCSSCRVNSTMDKLWFYQNILAFEPHVVSLQSLLTSPKSIRLRPDSPDDEKSSTQSQGDDHKDRRPQRLDIIIPRKPQLFQLPSSFSTSTPSKRRLGTRQKSLSELEKYELKGFMDLGFTFPKDKLSAYMMSMVPALQRLSDEDEEDESKRGVVRRPYLSEAWLFSNPVGYSQLRMLPKSLEGANDNMKRHIKYWAKRVAMIVHHEEPETETSILSNHLCTQMETTAG